MQKIPTLFERDWNGDRSRVTRIVNPACWWVIEGKGEPSRKRDGQAVLLRGGCLFKRYDAKPGRKPPEGFEPCGAPDEITGHHPGWAPITESDAYIRVAFMTGPFDKFAEGTYEIFGPKIGTRAGANPEAAANTRIVRHGVEVLHNVPRDFDGIKAWLSRHPMEGIVWRHAEYFAKIKAKDFGLPWPVDRLGPACPVCGRLDCGEMGGCGQGGSR
jgi:hypothetical protein